MKTPHLFLDYETYSEADLKKVGGFEYSKHPSTEILCAAFRFGTLDEIARAKTVVWFPDEASPHLGKLLQGLLDPSVKLIAQNSLFEQMITANVLGPKYMPSKPGLRAIPVERWNCTAALSRSVGLPGNLEGAGAALGLSAQKDMDGHRLMLKMSKPKKPSKKDPSTRFTDPALLERLAEYCARDVDTTVELFLKLPPLHPVERRFWVMNQKMNLRGFQVDRTLVKKALRLIEHQTVRLDLRAQEITGGRLKSARQRDGLLKFLKREGMVLPNLQAQTVREALEKGEFPNDKVREVLEIRDTIARSSTAKYQAFEMRSRFDGRARDTTIFYGAHTGRDSGTGVQPQNLFKRIISQPDVDLGIELIRRGDRNTIEALYKKPMELYASSLRGCIVPANGFELQVGDFATIEVRVLFWLAGHLRGLQDLAGGIDLYCKMAGRIFRCDPEIIRKLYKAEDVIGIFRRQLGKQTVLGGGFGIGVDGKKFQLTCKQYNMEIPIELAQRAVKAYREENPRIPIFWRNIERAAIMACQNPGKRYRLGFIIWERRGDFLTCQLPIGRKLSYFKPRITKVKKPWGVVDSLSYMGVLSPSKIFGRVSTWGGKLTENVVQAIARDLLYEGLERLHASGRSPVLPVHDEIVSEKSAGDCTLLEFNTIMSTAPAWAKGLPIKVEAWKGFRYRK